MDLLGKLRRGGERRPMVGPLLLYDLVRSSRTGQIFGHRSLYASVLLLVLGLVYWNYFPRDVLKHFLHGASVPIRDRAQFAGAFFLHFMEAQFVMVLLITPLYTAGVIAEEKERRTLEFLFVTDLSNREIILGVLGARLGRLLLLVLTGLPFMSMLEFLGGVDPNLLIAGFVATAMVMLSLGSMCILASVHARSALGAVLSGYSIMLMMALMLVWPFLLLAYALLSSDDLQLGRGLILLLLAFGLVHGGIALPCCLSAIASVRRQAMR